MHPSIERLFVVTSGAGDEKIRLVDSLGRTPVISRRAGRMDGSGAEYLAILISTGGSLPVRLWKAVTLRGRIGKSTAWLRRLGAIEVRAFVAVPDIDDPIFLYEFGTAAATYASRNLQLGRARFRGTRAIVGAVMGCDPAAGAVLVVGRVQ